MQATSATPTTTTTTSAATPLFSPVDGGDGRACRGRSARDNSATYYEVVSGVTQLGDCKAKCVATAGCVGIEHNPRGRGRCEVWTRSEGIQASIPLPGFTCLRLGEPSTTRPIGSLGTFESLGADTGAQAPETTLPTTTCSSLGPLWTFAKGSVHLARAAKASSSLESLAGEDAKFGPELLKRMLLLTASRATPSLRLGSRP